MVELATTADCYTILAYVMNSIDALLIVIREQ